MKNLIIYFVNKMDDSSVITIDENKHIYEKYTKYAKEGNDDAFYAYYRLGIIYNKGLYVKKDNIIALRLLGKFLKEIHENSKFYSILNKVLYYIGKIYLEEKDVKNDDQALKFLKKAKEKGSQEASEMLLRIYEKEIKIDDLPNEILVMIFSKMDNKSLFESFFVSNHWKNLIAYYFFDQINSVNFYSQYTLPINIMRRYRDDLDWRSISRLQELTMKYMKEFEDKICWDEFRNGFLSIPMMRNFKHKLDWKYISVNRKMKEIHIREFREYIDWKLISQYQKLSGNFIKEFQDKVDWKIISQFQQLSEDFIREFQDILYWEEISQFQKLSEDFIREFQNKVIWRYISSWSNLSFHGERLMSNRLSEDFIREFQHKVNWELILKNQHLSEDFIREFKDILDWELISQYQKLSENFIREFQDKFDWRYIDVKKYSVKFRREFEDKIKAARGTLLTIFAI